MDMVLLILAFVLLAAGFLGAVLPVLPGPPLSFIGLLLLQWIGRTDFSPGFFVLWGVISAAVTAMDYILPAVLTKKFGGSKAATIGSLLGLFAGIFIFPPFGIIIGPFFGALIGELIHNHTDGAKAVTVALGAFLSFIVGTGAKLVTSGVMIFYAIKEMFF